MENGSAQGCREKIKVNQFFFHSIIHRNKLINGVKTAISLAIVIQYRFLSFTELPLLRNAKNANLRVLSLIKAN